MKYICRACEGHKPCVLDVHGNAVKPTTCPWRDSFSNKIHPVSKWQELPESDYFEMRGFGKTQITENCVENCANNDETCSMCNQCDGSLFEAKIRPAATPEPYPKGKGQFVFFEVMKDICARADAGQKKYGTMLRTENGRNALNDAIQEAIDLVFYLKQAAMEKDTK
mgnify:CR=1 FL=1